MREVFRHQVAPAIATVAPAAHAALICSRLPASPIPYLDGPFDD